MATAPVIPQVSVEEYERTPSLFKRHEYVHGQLLEKPSPTIKHSVLQGWLSVLFYKHFSSLLHGPELHSKVRESTWRIPDFAVQRRGIVGNEKFAYAPLLLAVEIRSPEDRWSESFGKCEDYHEWGVPFCWVLDPESERAWIYHRGKDLFEVTAHDNIEAGDIRLALSEIFSVLQDL